MQFFLITLATAVLTFLLNPVFKSFNKRFDSSKSTKLHFHHSVIGVLLIVAGIVVSAAELTAAGLGIYLAHGLEEMYFNKRSPLKAFFVFITR